VAFVGVETEHDQEGFNLIKALALKFQKLSQALDLGHKLPEDASQTIANSLQHPGLEVAWKAMGRLLSRPWWTRAWIAQDLGVRDAHKRAASLTWTEVADFSLLETRKIPGHMLTNVLARFKSRQCGNPLDKIYASSDLLVLWWGLHSSLWIMACRFLCFGVEQCEATHS
jgi:hypothetical protein